MIGVKGEVLLLENDELNLSETLFMTNGCYIVPKQPNRFLIGATSEFDNYSVGTTKKGVKLVGYSMRANAFQNLNIVVFLRNGQAFVHIQTMKCL